MNTPHSFDQERVQALLTRLCEKEDLSGVEYEPKWALITEKDLTYFELRSFLIYLNKHVQNAATKTVVNELIRVLTRMELSSVPMTGMTKRRIAGSKNVIR